MAAHHIDDSLRLAYKFAELMRDAKLDGASGCAALAFAYGMWIEAQSDGDPLLVPAMMDIGKHTAQVTFDRLRETREAQEQLVAEALEAGGFR
jgi:hypothetical protein